MILSYTPEPRYHFSTTLQCMLVLCSRQAQCPVYSLCWLYTHTLVLVYLIPPSLRNFTYHVCLCPAHSVLYLDFYGLQYVQSTEVYHICINQYHVAAYCYSSMFLVSADQYQAFMAWGFHRKPVFVFHGQDSGTFSEASPDTAKVDSQGEQYRHLPLLPRVFTCDNICEREVKMFLSSWRALRVCKASLILSNIIGYHLITWRLCMLLSHLLHPITSIVHQIQRMSKAIFSSSASPKEYSHWNPAFDILVQSW